MNTRIFNASVLFIVLLQFNLPAWADTRITIATREVPPFAYLDNNQQWQGIAIELWEKIAADLALKSQYEAVSLEDMLNKTSNGDITAAVGALSVTPEREERFDFSHPFYNTGLGIAVNAENTTSWGGILRSFISPAFLGAVGGLLALLAAVGAIVWLVEHRKNPQFPKNPTKGIGAGLWWSSVTMTTVGYGDKSPITLMGRVIGLVWMFASIILISTITASITAALTLDALDSNIQAEEDLYRVKTGTVANSTSERRLQLKGIGHRTYSDISEALEALAAGKIEAVVYDRPLLRYLAKTHFANKIHVLKISFDPQHYAIGLPSNSPYREAINQRLLQYTRGPEWEQLLTRHLGE